MMLIEKCIGEEQCKDIVFSCVVSMIERECEIIVGEGKTELRVLSSRYEIDTQEKKICDSSGKLFDFDTSDETACYFSERDIAKKAIIGDFVLGNDFDKRIISGVERSIRQGLSILVGKARSELKQTMRDWCKIK